MGTKKYIKNRLKSRRRRNKRGTSQKQGYRGVTNSKIEKHDMQNLPHPPKQDGM